MSTAGTLARVRTASPSERAAALPRPGMLLPALSLCRRELVRFLRQRSRVMGALVTPVMFWIFIGALVGNNLKAGEAHGESYFQFFFPGTITMILLFTAIFSTISIIEDRKEGFLQSVLVAPVSRAAAVLGKILGGTVLAAGQALLFLLAAPLVGFHFTPLSFVMAVLIILILAFALTSLGFAIAWSMTSTQGFHTIMNLFLLPLWLFSGAMFPAQGAKLIVKWLITANPMTYGLAGLRHTMLLGDGRAMHLSSPGLAVDVIVTCAFAVLMYFLAAMVARRDTAADLQ